MRVAQSVPVTFTQWWCLQGRRGLYGQVVDKRKKTGVTGVQLTLVESGLSAPVDDHGHFTFYLPPGHYSLKAMGKGFLETSEVSSAKTE